MPINFRSYADMAATIHRNLGMVAGQEFDLVVGLPRSGIIPAYMIALDLNIAVCSLPDLIANHSIKRAGVTRQIRSVLERPADARKILLVDDSYNTGESLANHLAQLPAKLRGKVKTLAVYAAHDHPTVDYFLELVPQPRVFEWNIFHHESTLASSCFDLDGVLCEDPTDQQNDDGEHYLAFIADAPPKYIPTHKIKTIVTSRLETYRAPTEAWLQKHHVDYERLVMLEGYTAEERRRKGVHALLKIQEYRKPDYQLFFESNYEQARAISQQTGKPVYCVDANAMLFPEATERRADRWKAAVKRRRWLRSALLPGYKLYRLARSLVR